MKRLLYILTCAVTTAAMISCEGTAGNGENTNPTGAYTLVADKTVIEGIMIIVHEKIRFHMESPVRIAQWSHSLHVQRLCIQCSTGHAGTDGAADKYDKEKYPG